MFKKQKGKALGERRYLQEMYLTNTWSRIHGQGLKLIGKRQTTQYKNTEKIRYFIKEDIQIAINNEKKGA